MCARLRGAREQLDRLCSSCPLCLPPLLLCSICFFLFVPPPPYCYPRFPFLFIFFLPPPSPPLSMGFLQLLSLSASPSVYLPSALAAVRFGLFSLHPLPPLSLPLRSRICLRFRRRKSATASSSGSSFLLEFDSDSFFVFFPPSSSLP